jgi:GNAT superfamily N-acetyltransferase
MSIEIFAARPEDCETLHALIRGLAEYERLLDRVVGSAEALRAELFGERPVIEAVLARVDGGVAGFALYFHNYSTFLARRGLYLEDLFVVPAQRGKGIGAALIRHLASIAVQRGCGRFEWSVLDWNEPAIRFYRAIGAELLPDWRICRVSGDALFRLAGPARAADPIGGTGR